MADNKKPIPNGGGWREIPARERRDEKTYSDSEPVKFDSTIPVPKGRGVNESHPSNPESNKKSK